MRIHGTYETIADHSVACLPVPSVFCGRREQFRGYLGRGRDQEGGTALFLFPDGRAYFNAMCGKALGTWKIVKSPNTIEVTLQEDSDGPVDHLTLQLDKKGWLIRQQTGGAPTARQESVASESLQELEKTAHKLPKVE